MKDHTLTPIRQAFLNSWLRTAGQEGPFTSNQPALPMPFQRWFKFKEAFAPRFVVETLNRLPYKPNHCLDPFGGSGTTALACQFFGVNSTTIEVNPFMADVIEAKLTKYDPIELRYSFCSSFRRALRNWKDYTLRNGFPGAPKTFVEPGMGGRWIFNRKVAKAILALRFEIQTVTNPAHRRFLTVMLGSVLVDASNVRVNGKGRRYRNGWQHRDIDGLDVFVAFKAACFTALADIEAFSQRRCNNFQVIKGDARKLITDSGTVDLVLTSPPYPNSFDYTDIYNIELWALGYLASPTDNRKLRESTLRSHVQIAHNAPPSVLASKTLSKTYKALSSRRRHLWNPRIPEMVCHYFEDMRLVLKGCETALARGGHLVLAVGDSRYKGIHIDVASILKEIGEEMGFHSIRTEKVRSMRSSAQQGGRHVLNESLVWFRRC